MPGASYAATRRRGHPNAYNACLDSGMVIGMSRNEVIHPEAELCHRRRGTPRKGIALLICLFVLSLATVWTVDMLESASVYQSAQRNSIEYEQALYQANAGIQHVLYQLESDTTWRGTATAGGVPPTGAPSATAGEGAPHGGGRVKHPPPGGGHTT